MNNNFYSPENIEAYLENSLTSKEKALFESEIAKDPLLQNEVRLQRDIVESLKNYRKLELKNRLNSIEVSLAPKYVGVKIAASILLSGLLGLGIYSYLNKPTQSIAIATKENKEIIINEPAAVETSAIDNSTEISKNKEETKTADYKDHNVASKSSSKNTSPQTIESAIAIESVKPASPSIEQGFDSELFHKDESINLPDGKIAQITETKSSIDIRIDGSTDKKFHYKYYNNKLFLYGNFDSKTYEILELNTYKGKQVYLKYDNSYYRLTSNKLEISPLTKITDKKALEELNKLDK